MYGVVLWSGDEGRKAVIWCEDHGDLAFFHDPQNVQVLEAGDMVQLRTEHTRRMRLAHDVHVVEQHRFPGIAERVKKAGGQRGGSEVVAFPRRPNWADQDAQTPAAVAG